MPATLAIPSGVKPGGFASVTTSDIQAALQNSPEWGFGPGIAFAGAQLDGGSQFQTALNLISFCKDYSYYWAIRAVIDLVYQRTCPLTQFPGPLVVPQVDIGYQVMTGGTALGTNFSPFQISSVEAAFPLQQSIGYVSNLLATFDVGIDQKIYPAGYLSLRACGRTNASLGIQQFGYPGGSNVLADSTGTVELSLLGNSDDFGLVREAESMALSMNGILHWGQSNGLMTANDVKQRFPKLPEWQANQQILGGATFTNQFMKRCGLA